MFKILFKIIRWAALVALVLGIAVWFYPELFLTVDSGPVTADIIIVIGGGSHERPLRAAQLFQLHGAPRVLITGAGDDGINRQLLVLNGVPARAIEVENKSATTCENAEFAIERLRAENIHSAILVTSWYHARRVLKTFEHFAPDMKFYSRPSYFAFDRNDWKNLGINRRMRLEFLKLPGYWIRYGISPF